MKFVNLWDKNAPKRTRKLRKRAKMALKRAKSDWIKFLISIGWDPDAQDFPL